MWIVKHIIEVDYGCEERSGNESLMVLITLDSDDVRVMQFEVEDACLLSRELMKVTNDRMMLKRILLKKIKHQI